MRNSNHTKFILTPIFEILQDCVIATKGIRDGMESFPLCEYIMQTTFLKLTGASEQKLKCILWEIATNDYEFRYEFLRPQTSYGECSSLEDKRKVFKLLQHQIQSLNSDNNYFNDIFNDCVKKQIKDKIATNVKQLLLSSVLVSWQEKEFLFFENNIKSFFSEKYFCNYNKKNNSNTISLLEKNIDYERLVYKQRNRCAHNLLSYQLNLPDLSILANKNYDYENYFFRFSVLILLDEIFMRIYSEYLDCLVKNR